MTIEEAIKHCEEVAEKNERRAESVRNRPISSADFCHEEESCGKCASEHRQLAEWLKELKAYKEQSDDAISRQVAIDAFERFIHELGIEDEPYNYGEMALSAKNVPPVTPQQRTGHWIIIDDCEQFIAKCSECGRIEDSRMISTYLYCHCGAKMEVKENG